VGGYVRDRSGRFTACLIRAVCRASQRLFSTWQQSSLRARNFDLERYERLTADIARFRRYIRHLHK